MTIGFTVTWPKENRGIELGRGIKGIFISGAEITDTKTGLVQNFSYTFVSHFSVSHNETYSASGRDEECSERGDYKPFIISLARRSAVEKIYNDDDTIKVDGGG